MFEVEAKFKISDVEEYRQQLRQRFDAEFGPVRQESDLFFQHNVRDFCQTDECLRLRVSSQGVFITYKGPKLDTQTKTREEIDLPVSDFASSEKTVVQWRTLFERLGFVVAAQVVKRRCSTSVQWSGTTYEVTLDELPGLGFFTEWETVCDSMARIDECRAKLLNCVSTFNLGDSIRKSYLELQSKIHESTKAILGKGK